MKVQELSDGLRADVWSASRTGSSLFFENQLLSYKEAARYLRISEPYLRRLKRQGSVPFVPVGRRGVRFRLSSLSSWVEKREVG
jgi:excisionase family DNA binding protein